MPIDRRSAEAVVPIGAKRCRKCCRVTRRFRSPTRGAAGGAAAANWLDRWIDITQVVPRPQTERQSEPATASPAAPSPKSGSIPHFVVILAFFAFLLIFATIEIMLRNDERQK